MRGSDVMQIRIKGNLIGIISLEKVMEEMAPDYARRSDEEIGSEMIKRISTKNYIPSSAENHYAIALVREFKRFMGQPVEEEAVSGIRALVLGPGCAQCSRLEMDVREAMAEMKAPGEIIHISDIREIGKYGVMGTPALIINEKVVSVGTKPDKSKIRRWLEEAAG